MNSCGVQRVVLGIFRGLMVESVVFDVPLLLGFLTAFGADGLTALPAFSGVGGALLVAVFDFRGLVAADLVLDADGRAMVNSFGGW